MARTFCPKLVIELVRSIDGLTRERGGDDTWMGMGKKMRREKMLAYGPFSGRFRFTILFYGFY
jgi:hypothetical protein